MRGSGTLLQRLIASAEQSYDPEQARKAGGRALFDHLACLRAGRRLGPRCLGDAGAAAALDRDDIHWPSLTHPGAAIWSALSQTGVQGDQRWRAAHLGYEVTARLGKALGGEHRRYWHATTTAGTVGTAAAAAVALGTDPVLAAGHAISVAGGSIVCILQRTGTRLLHRDHAAAAGLMCARAASLGSAEDCLEHSRGMFAAMGGDPDALLEAGERSALAEVSFREHATSGFCQALVEAAGELGPLQEVTSAIVDAPRETIALAGIDEPRDLEEAWWSCRHAVAVTLLGLDLEDPSLVRDERVAAQREAIELREGSTSRVTVAGRSAERERATQLSDAGLLAKWSALNPGTSPPAELLA